MIYFTRYVAMKGAAVIREQVKDGIDSTRWSVLPVARPKTPLGEALRDEDWLAPVAARLVGGKPEIDLYGLSTDDSEDYRALYHAIYSRLTEAERADFVDPLLVMLGPGARTVVLESVDGLTPDAVRVRLLGILSTLKGADPAAQLMSYYKRGKAKGIVFSAADGISRQLPALIAVISEMMKL